MSYCPCSNCAPCCGDCCCCPPYCPIMCQPVIVSEIKLHIMRPAKPFNPCEWSQCVQPCSYSSSDNNEVNIPVMNWPYRGHNLREQGTIQNLITVCQDKYEQELMLGGDFFKNTEGFFTSLFDCSAILSIFCDSKGTRKSKNTTPDDELNSDTFKFIRNDIQYVVYTTSIRNGEFFTHYDLDYYDPPYIDREKVTKILIHGMLLSLAPDEKLKDSYIINKGYNVILVDWTKVKQKLLYPLPADGAQYIGACISEMMIKVFAAEGNNVSKVHLIGHSVGAHAAGFAGRILMEKGFDIDRITGLDAANPYVVGGLNKSDARFVDIIHTNAQNLGKYVMGHADFYVNGGSGEQPNCWGGFPPAFECNTLMSYQYYDESIKHPLRFKASKCHSIKALKKRTCKGRRAYMGESVSVTARGLYYINVDDLY